MAPFHFAVVTRGAGPDALVFDAQFLTADVHDVLFVRLRGVAELTPVVRLQDLRGIPEVPDRPLDEVGGAVPGLLHVGVDEPLPRGLVDHGVLVVLLRHLSCVADGRDVLHVHLPLYTGLFRGIIRLRLIGFLFRGLSLPVAEADEDTVEGARVPPVAMGFPQFPVHLAGADVGVPAVQVPYLLQFLLRMGVGMGCTGPVGAVRQGSCSAVVPLVPAHEGGLGDMVAAADKGNILFSAIEPHGVDPRSKFMWQIPLGMCYTTVHGGSTLLSCSVW